MLSDRDYFKSIRSHKVVPRSCKKKKLDDERTNKLRLFKDDYGFQRTCNLLNISNKTLRGLIQGKPKTITTIDRIEKSIDNQFKIWIAEQFKIKNTNPNYKWERLVEVLECKYGLIV